MNHRVTCTIKRHAKAAMQVANFFLKAWRKGFHADVVVCIKWLDSDGMMFE